MGEDQTVHDARHADGRVLSILDSQTGTRGVRLSNRKQECLQWAAGGKTIDDTATILGLSASAVRNYLDSARHKLDCLTKPHAVARALQLGIITF